MTKKPENAQEAVQDAPRGAITNDPELVAIGRIAKLLGGLDEPARYRVLEYLNSKFDPSLVLSPGFRLKTNADHQ